MALIKLSNIFILSLIYVSAISQTYRDTSYTVNSAYKKIGKDFPNAKVVEAKLDTQVSILENLIYKKIGNRRLKLDVYWFNQERKNPAIFLIHGGGWKSGDKRHMKPLAMRLAKEGYTCVNIEYRLSTEAIYPSSIIDVLDAINYLKLDDNKYHIDRDKIAILGGSSGAQMATLIGVLNVRKTNSNLWKDKVQNTELDAIINMDGILAFQHPESEEGSLAAEWLGGGYNEIPEIWVEASPLEHVDVNTPPVLFINSQYPRFHAGRDDMIGKMDSLDIYTEVRNIENSPHTFWLFHPWFEECVMYILNYLNKVFNYNY